MLYVRKHVFIPFCMSSTLICTCFFYVYVKLMFVVLPLYTHNWLAIYADILSYIYYAYHLRLQTCYFFISPHNFDSITTNKITNSTTVELIFPTPIKDIYCCRPINFAISHLINRLSFGFHRSTNLTYTATSCLLMTQQRTTRSNYQTVSTITPPHFKYRYCDHSHINHLRPLYPDDNIG